MPELGFLVGWALVYYLLRNTAKREKRRRDEDDEHMGIGA